MPSCSRAKNPSGYEIDFDEATHAYTSIINGLEVKYISGTQFLHHFYPEFDPTGEITKRCALREGLSVDEIKAKWKAKGAESCRLGTRMHETCEDTFYSREYRNTPENLEESHRFEHAKNMSRKIMKSADILGVEKIVFSPTLKIAGTIDLFARAKKDGTYLIIDHKSNATIDQFNKYNSFCKDPISHVPGINFHEYALQLNLYCYLLKHEHYVDKNASFRFFLNHVTAQKAELIELPNYQNEIKDMLIYYLSHPDQFTLV